MHILCVAASMGPAFFIMIVLNANAVWAWVMVQCTAAAGSFCPANEDMFRLCPANTMSAPGSSARQQCIALAGFYGEPGGNMTLCPADRYCPVGAINPAGCPPNTFSTSGSSTLTDCKVSVWCVHCIFSGTVRERTPITLTSIDPQAQPGFEGQAGSPAIACSPGFYCPAAATKALPCPVGTTSQVDAASLKDCVPARGYFGTPGTEGTLCLQAHYCPGSGTLPVDCPANTNSLLGAGGSVECWARAGFYGEDGYVLAIGLCVKVCVST